MDLRVQVGRQLCQTNHDESDAHDPCNMAKGFEKALFPELVSEISYGMAAALCTADCAFTLAGSSGDACKTATLLVGAVDLAAAAWFAAESDEMLKKLGGLATQATVVVGAGKAGAGWRTTACLTGLTNAVQAMARHKARSDFRESIRDLHAQKWCLMAGGLNLNSLTASQEFVAKSAGATGGINGDVSMSGDGYLSPENAARETDKIFSRMTAQQQSFFDGSFNRDGINGKELMANVLSGKAKNGYEAALHALGAGKLGDKGALAAKEISGLANHLAATRKKELAEADRKYNPNSTAAMFASAGGGTRAPAKEANPLAGFGDLLTQMMPGGQKKADLDRSGTAGGVNFGTRGPAAAALAQREGLHTSDQSLFDVVGSRYQAISRRFMSEGDQPEYAPSAGLPENPYLTR